MLNFHKGNYYAKICSFNMKKDEKTIVNIAQKNSSMLKGSVNLPEISTKFPAEGNFANSERYVNEDYLGYSQFKEVFTVEYEL